MHKCMNNAVAHKDASTQFFNCWSQPVNIETSERDTSDGETSGCQVHCMSNIYNWGKEGGKERKRQLAGHQKVAAELLTYTHC